MWFLKNGQIMERKKRLIRVEVEIGLMESEDGGIEQRHADHIAIESATDHIAMNEVLFNIINQSITNILSLWRWRCGARIWGTERWCDGGRCLLIKGEKWGDLVMQWMGGDWWRAHHTFEIYNLRADKPSKFETLCILYIAEWTDHAHVLST